MKPLSIRLKHRYERTKQILENASIKTDGHKRQQEQVLTLMKTARLWLAFRAASRLSLYFCVMCGMIRLTSVSTE